MLYLNVVGANRLFSPNPEKFVGLPITVTELNGHDDFFEVEYNEFIGGYVGNDAYSTEEQFRAYCNENSTSFDDTVNAAKLAYADKWGKKVDEPVVVNG